ncbi:cytochrome P450 [Kutzneria albida]|uniref:Cytochrome P450 n=1 Tax=Kutzneria albida DSM 43870 TaxID=1449976 RepID=W5WFX8_9PSEU|nr:cytochrome P450 [Kutzneria albida]AHH99620.1 hypothetical protein KALB_6260 [Kutzneria albida DSM 43870]
MTLPPGPRGHFLLGSALGFRRDPLGTFERAWREHGRLVRFRGPVEVYLVTDPAHLERILVSNVDNYPHPADFDRKVGAFVGRSLVTTNGTEWERRRAAVEPAFRREPLLGYGQVVTERSTAMLDRWQAARGPFDLGAEMRVLTLDVLARSLFDAEWSEQAPELAEAVRVGMEYLNQELISVLSLPEWLPTPRNLRLRKARARLDRSVYALIAERRRTGGSDLLSMLLSTSDKEVRDHVVSMFVAGHVTVAATLTWAFTALSREVEVVERIRAELSEVVGSRPPTGADLPHLRYLRMVVQEVLRLYPPLWQVPRTPVRADELGGHRIPAGSFLLLNTYLAHRDPEYWERPERFEPERFERGRSARRPRFAYLPYLGGPRSCVGLALANLELTLVLAAVLQRFSVDVPGPVRPSPDLVLEPRDVLASVR